MMEAIRNWTGVVAPLNRANVDTDAIIPKQFLKRIERSGFGPFLFYDWRFDGDGMEKLDFVLNKPAYRNATILLARQNFGCGSSREHAPWALADYGFRVMIAPSFADIFYNNCLKNGIVPIILPEAEVEGLFQKALEQVGYELSVDVEQGKVFDSQGWEASFELDPHRQMCLVNGWDDIDLTLRYEDKIRSFEQRRKEA